MNEEIVLKNVILSKIYFLRNQKVMLDKDLAEIYGVSTKVFNQVVKRNSTRFPEEFMFQLSDNEEESLRSQFVTSNKFNFQRGGNKYMPYAFIENGIAMLSSILNTETAIQVNISILRLFKKTRHIMFENKDLLLKLQEMENAVGEHGRKIDILFRYIREFLEETPKNIAYKQIGFKQKSQEKIN